MPIIKSAKKRVKVARKATVRNAKTKRSLRLAVKAFQSAVSGPAGGKKSTDSHAKAQSALDKAGKKGLMHKNKIARKKRQLAAAAKKAGVSTASAVAKTAIKKAPTAKKAVAKKTPAKKPAVKKPATKKK